MRYRAKIAREYLRIYGARLKVTYYKNHCEWWIENQEKIPACLVILFKQFIRGDTIETSNSIIMRKIQEARHA